MGILKNFEGDGHENEHVNAISHIDTLVNTNHLNASPSSSEDEETHESTFVPAPPTITVVPLTTSNRTPKIKKSTSKIPKPILQIKNIGSKKSQGHRQARRHENMCFLLNLAKDLDEDFAEVNINDLVETTISAFAQLLLSKNKMKIWNEFIELPESQQEHIVKMATNKKKARKFRQEKNKQRFNNDSTSISCSSDDNFETFVLIENHTTMNNNESIHPLHQQEEADKCFRRIDPNIRYTLKSMLKRHHLPLDRISCFEDDVIPFFKEHSDSVYLRDLNNGFDRMLLHAVCQYLNLISKSRNQYLFYSYIKDNLYFFLKGFTQDGERYIQVENRRNTFVPPIILLSEYIMLLNGTIKTDL
ncbi:unnamed protein product [Rotaria sp. Silwood2]|nr:unnamed protein product [Rotaria sp. Silwood2]CAF2644503.1 unnamed protein product [Rotaria sp. Silwood2]CAF2904553.1 unnamed protein product [Rotaria sp. Silwood2]CAF3057973.1 unnamed protein product [Rotaria sp. Silwood2]